MRSALPRRGRLRRHAGRSQGKRSRLGQGELPRCRLHGQVRACDQSRSTASETDEGSLRGAGLAGRGRGRREDRVVSRVRLRGRRAAYAYRAGDALSRRECHEDASRRRRSPDSYRTGRSSSQAEVQKYVPSFPRKGSPLRIAHLASHQSGIRHYAGSEALNTEALPKRLGQPGCLRPRPAALSAR